jgi:hypothetical protein
MAIRPQMFGRFTPTESERNSRPPPVGTLRSSCRSRRPLLFADGKIRLFARYRGHESIVSLVSSHQPLDVALNGTGGFRDGDTKTGGDAKPGPRVQTENAKAA